MNVIYNQLFIKMLFSKNQYEIRGIFMTTPHEQVHLQRLCQQPHQSVGSYRRKKIKESKQNVWMEKHQIGQVRCDR